MFTLGLEPDCDIADAGIEKPTTEETGRRDFEDALSDGCRREAHDFFSGAGFGGAGAGAVADVEGSGAGARVRGTEVEPESVGVGVEEVGGGVAEPGTETDGVGSGVAAISSETIFVWSSGSSEETDSAVATVGGKGFAGFSTAGKGTGGTETEVLVEMGEPGMGVSGAVEHAGVDSVAEDEGTSSSGY